MEPRSRDNSISKLLEQRHVQVMDVPLLQAGAAAFVSLSSTENDTPAGFNNGVTCLCHWWVPSDLGPVAQVVRAHP